MNKDEIVYITIVIPLLNKEGYHTIKIPFYENRVDYIFTLVCKYLNLSKDISKSKIRKREYVWCRYYAMFFAKLYTKKSMEKIGIIIGLRDHATVCRAVKEVKNLMANDDECREEMRRIDSFLVKKINIPEILQEKFYKIYAEALYYKKRRNKQFH